MPEPARLNGILVPLETTVAKYGITLMEWSYMLEDQDFACGCCGKVPSSGRLFIDHEHVRGWTKMPPEERRFYVRGLACYVCNRFVLNYRINATLLRQAADYLDRYSARNRQMREG